MNCLQVPSIGGTYHTVKQYDCSIVEEESTVLGNIVIIKNQT